MTTLGFGCRWDHRRPERTWSHIPWNLRAALAARVELVDLPAQRHPVLERALVQAHHRLHPARPIGAWRFSRLNEALNQRRLLREARRCRPDVAVVVNDLGHLPMPHWYYQDLSFAVLDRHHGDVPARYLGLTAADDALYERRRRRQSQLYEQAAGVFTMSRWLADGIVAAGLLPAERVHPVWAGINVEVDDRGGAPVERRPGPPRLLFVGRDFHRKGGDLVVRATELLRTTLDRETTLTVVGPDEWPMPGPPPPGVRFLGRLDPSATVALWRDHDVFVMPSRFEAFGIVFVEALAHGMPCVARDVYAMPEIVDHGRTGLLVGGDDVDELAEAITRCVTERSFAVEAQTGRASVLERYSWDAVADRMLSVIDRV